MLREMFNFNSASDTVKTYVLRLRRAKQMETLEVMVERLEADAKNADKANFAQRAKNVKLAFTACKPLF